MKSPCLFVSFLGAAALLGPGLLAGQPIAISKQIEIAPPLAAPSEAPTLRYQYLSPTVLDLGLGAGYGVAWMTGFNSSDFHDFDRFAETVSGRRVTRLATPAEPFQISTETRGGVLVGPPVLAGLSGNRFVAVWCESRDQNAALWFRRYQSDTRAIDGEARRLGSEVADQGDCSPAVASQGADRFVVAWMRNTIDPSAGGRAEWTPMVQIFDPNGGPLTPEVAVSAPSPGANPYHPAVGVDRAGNFVVLWQSLGVLADAPRTIWGQRFDPSGNPVGDRFLVGGTLDGNIALAMRFDGELVATWEDLAIPRQDRPLVLQRFGKQNEPLGGTVTIALSHETYDPALAMDGFGNLLVFWIQGKRPALALFNADLVRQGPIVFDPPASQQPFLGFRGAGLAVAADGRFLTAWIGPRGAKARDSILGRIWQARKDADLCVFRDGVFLCDTANDGGTAEARLPFGERGDLPFLADFNGDGRADPCVLHDHHFRCDIARDGVGLESSFFIPSDVQPLLGDMDGDGGADPCFRSVGLWTCQIFTLNGLTTIHFTFGAADATGLLGDVSGDGETDACVYAGGRISCDTAHDGGAAEVTFDLRSALGRSTKGTPLLGDVDGDGRADPCLYDRGRLTCGIFKPGGGKPVRVVTLSFGKAGDLVALGDLDAF